MESFIPYDIQLYDHIRFYDDITLTTLVCKLLVSYWIVNYNYVMHYSIYYSLFAVLSVGFGAI